jgi:hypothetical protein
MIHYLVFGSIYISKRGACGATTAQARIEILQSSCHLSIQDG